MTSADERIYQAIRAHGCPLTQAEIAVETGLRSPAIGNGLRELIRQQRVGKVEDNGETLWMVIA